MGKNRSRGVKIDGAIIAEEMEAYQVENGIDSFRHACESLGLVHTTVYNAINGKNIDFSTAKDLERVGFTVVYKGINRRPKLKKLSKK